MNEDGEYTILKRQYIERGCRIAELEAEVTSLNSCVQVRRKQVVKLKAKLDAVEEEVRNIDETFSHPDTTSHEAYRNIRSIVQGLRKTLGEAK